MTQIHYSFITFFLHLHKEKLIFEPFVSDNKSYRYWDLLIMLSREEGSDLQIFSLPHLSLHHIQSSNLIPAIHTGYIHITPVLLPSSHLLYLIPAIHTCYIHSTPVLLSSLHLLYLIPAIHTCYIHSTPVLLSSLHLLYLIPAIHTCYIHCTPVTFPSLHLLCLIPDSRLLEAKTCILFMPSQVHK